MDSQRFLRHVVTTALSLPLAARGARPTRLVKTGQHACKTSEGPTRINYLLFLPQDYGKEPEVQWPLMLFLHGVAKRGDRLEELDLLKVDGPPMLVEEQPDYPFVVLSLQCPSDSWWEPQLDKLDALLDEIVAAYAVDRKRIYLTSLSTGGFGAWHFALRHPTRFAAIVPIAGGYQFGSEKVPDKICDLKNVPIWVFHGADDEAVSPRQSEVMVEALQECQANVRFTLYPGAAHDKSRKLAYADPELYKWLPEQTLR